MDRSKLVGLGLGAVIAIGAGGLIVQRNQLEAQTSQLQVEKAQLQHVVQQEALRELPVTVGFRKAIFANGKVAEIRSISNVGMAIDATITDAASHQERHFTVNIDPGRMAEFGRNQGYTFEPGDKLVLSHDGYKSMFWIVQ
jgi:hypothetical protein